MKKYFLKIHLPEITKINFYEKLGFHFENIRPNYYGTIDAKIYGMNIDEK